MKLKIALTLSFSLVASAVMAAPKPAIDARAVATFDAAIAHYTRLRSFSVQAKQEVRGAEKPRLAQIETSIQFPYRARLKIDSLNAKGRVENPITRRLLDAKTYLAWDLVGPDFEPNANRYTLLKSEKQRQQVQIEFFMPAPDVALSVYAFAAHANPAKEKLVSRATFEKVEESGKTLDKIVVTRGEARKNNLFVIEYFLNSRTHEMAKFVLRRQVEGKNFVATTRFEPAKINWKDSQRATDAAVYNWKTIALPGIVAPTFQPKAIVKVDAAATKIF